MRKTTISLTSAVFMLAGLNTACAAAKNICGSTATKQTLAAILLKGDVPRDQMDNAWKSVNIVVLRQSTDETGSNINCTAAVNVTDAAMQGYYSKLDERQARATKFAESMSGKATSVGTFRYVINLGPNGVPLQLALMESSDEASRSVRSWLTSVVTGKF
ncbi:hypothetical protein AYO42_04985 [Rhizomicrobium sp. SCGC AG-212-E05]|nr:hypothetical protein AYO42_04985 [Rhizomicrobium sp. SCGC AG-212-E05]